MARRALTVIGQDFDDTATIHTTMAATFDHCLQFSSERRQAGDALFHICQSRLGNRVCGVARLSRIILQYEKGTDRINFKAKLPRVSDERQPVQVTLVKVSPITLSTGRRGQQFYLFIIADSRHLYAAAL